MKSYILAALAVVFLSAPFVTAQDGEVKTYIVAPTMRDGMGVGPMTCLQVKTDSEAQYGMFYSSIRGFDYVPGFEYTIKVRVTERERVPMDASKYIYTLEEVVSKKPAGLSLEKVTWELISYKDSAGRETKIIADSETTLSFKKGRVNGVGGINRYFGECKVNGVRLEVGMLGSTEMAGPPELMKQEQTFLDQLKKVAQYLIVGEQLRLKNSEGRVVLTFKPRKEAALSAGTWNATMVNNGKGGVASLVNGTAISLKFEEENRISGNAGCNMFSAQYTLENKELVITKLSVTDDTAEKPEGIMEQERAFLNALKNSARFQIEGNVLKLRSEKGSLQAQFVLAKEEKAAEAAE